MLSLGAATLLVTSQYSFLFGFSHHPPLRKNKRGKNSTTPFRTPLPQQVWGNGVQHIRFRKPGREKEAGLVLSILVRLPVASALPSTAGRSACSRRASASLLPAHVSQGSNGRKEVWAGRRGDWGLRCQRPPPLELGGVDSWCRLLALLLDRPCHLTVPVLLSCL